MIKKLLLASWLSVFSFVCFCQSGQRIDTSNYYNYLREGGSIGFLNSSDAIPIIIDEIKNAGFSSEFIEIGRLIKIDKTTSLVLQVSFNNSQLSFGFIYEIGHKLPVSVSDRDYLKDENREQYSQSEYPVNGTVKSFLIRPLPKNIFLLKECCYWYQFDANGNAYPVSKELAVKILRQDLKGYLNRMLGANFNVK